MASGSTIYIPSPVTIAPGIQVNIKGNISTNLRGCSVRITDERVL
jgi:hypothetical protein